MYYRGAAAAIIVYDITRSNTFKTLKNWVEELQSKGPKDIAIAIAGNKADLEEQRVNRFIKIIVLNFKSLILKEVDKTMAAAYAEEIGAMYLETSAKDDMNVQDIFVKLSKFQIVNCGSPMSLCFQAIGFLHRCKMMPMLLKQQTRICAISGKVLPSRQLVVSEQDDSAKLWNFISCCPQLHVSLFFFVTIQFVHSGIAK